MKLKWLDRPLISGPHLVLCLSDKSFQAAVKHLQCPKPLQFLGDDRSSGSVHTLENKSGSTVSIVSLHAPDASPIEIAGILVHEAVHVWQDYCRTIGEDEPSVEFEAYSIQTISQRLMVSYVEQTQKGGQRAKVNTR